MGEPAWGVSNTCLRAMLLLQAVCKRYGLEIGAYCAPLVRLLMVLTAPVAWPLGEWGPKGPLFCSPCGGVGWGMKSQARATAGAGGLACLQQVAHRLAQRGLTPAAARCCPPWPPLAARPAACRAPPSRQVSNLVPTLALLPSPPRQAAGLAAGRGERAVPPAGAARAGGAARGAAAGRLRWAVPGQAPEGGLWQLRAHGRRVGGLLHTCTTPALGVPCSRCADERRGAGHPGRARHGQQDGRDGDDAAEQGAPGGAGGATWDQRAAARSAPVAATCLLAPCMS